MKKLLNTEGESQNFSGESADEKYNVNKLQSQVTKFKAKKQIAKQTFMIKENRRFQKRQMTN